MDISDAEDKELRLRNPLPPSVNQNVRRKYQTQYNYNRNNTYTSPVNDNREQQVLYWEQQVYNYMELKDEITETVKDHTNKFIDNLEMKYQQMKKKWKNGKKNHSKWYSTDLIELWTTFRDKTISD